MSIQQGDLYQINSSTVAPLQQRYGLFDFVVKVKEADHDHDRIHFELYKIVGPQGQQQEVIQGIKDLLSDPAAAPILAQENAFARAVNSGQVKPYHAHR